jgi:hypothetical protein
MEPRERVLDELQLRDLPTTELLRHAVLEARLLARAEVLYARAELKAELKAARTSAILLGAGLALALAGLAALFVALALLLPLAEPLAALVVGAALLLLALGLALLASKRFPRKPLPRTQERLRTGVSLMREELQ